MLTDQQIAQSVRIAEEFGLLVGERAVSGTREPIANFGPSFHDYKRLSDTTSDDGGLPVRQIKEAQAQKGQTRADLIIIDFGDVRAIVQC